jgi:hypothetical protein
MEFTLSSAQNLFPTSFNGGTGLEGPCFDLEAIADMDISYFFPTASSTIVNNDINSISNSNLEYTDSNGVSHSVVRETTMTPEEYINQYYHSEDYEDVFVNSPCSQNEPCYFLCNGKPYNTIEECPSNSLITKVPCLVGGNPPKRRRGVNRKQKRPKPRMSEQSLNSVSNDRDCAPGNVYETTANLTTDISGQINLVIAMNNPTQMLPSVTATGAQDLANNWDAYSVERIVLKTQISAPIIARQGSWNLAADHDSSPPTTAITQALLNTYTKKKQYSSTASPSWSIVPKKLTQAEYISAVGADPEPAVIVSKGKYDWNTPPANGFIYVKLTGGPASTTIGTIYIRSYVTCWFKRRLALTVLPSMDPPQLPNPEIETEEEDVPLVKQKRKKVM